jgi:hypothetical protein
MAWVQPAKSPGRGERHPLPGSQGQPVRDHPQSRRVVAEAQVTASDLDVLPQGPARSMQARQSTMSSRREYTAVAGTGTGSLSRGAGMSVGTGYW